MGSTYLTSKMVLTTTLLLLIAFINGVQMYDVIVLESSGDYESPDLMSPVSLIDDNGDIYTESPTTVNPSTTVLTKVEKELAEDSLPKASNDSTFDTVTENVTEAVSESIPMTSTAAPTEMTVATTTQSTQTNPPTTESTKPDTTTVMSMTTTVKTTTSTTMSSTLDDEVTTAAEMETSTDNFEPTEQEKMDKSTESPQKRSTESTDLLPSTERSPCTFIDEGLICKDPLTCIGEGDVDCTDNDGPLYAEVTTESDKTVNISSNTPEELSEKRPSLVLQHNRRKRLDNLLESNSSSSQSHSFQVAALESSQRKLGLKACRLSGDLYCTPQPTTTSCIGKGHCRANSTLAVTTDSTTTTKSTTTSGTVGVLIIVICSVLVTVIICLITYFVANSCKKLKVQPSLEVTALNYINRGASENEVA